MPDDRQLLGAEGERVAERFLRRQGYKLLERNYRCPSGEIDLIALHRGTVVFIEVKTRAQAGYGSPFEAVDRRKQRQVIRAAQRYVVEHRLHDRDLRFDVVGVWAVEGEIRCELIQHAFDIS